MAFGRNQRMVGGDPATGEGGVHQRKCRGALLRQSASVLNFLRDFRFLLAYSCLFDRTFPMTKNTKPNRCSKPS